MILVFIRGGGDLASGVALRLHHAGLRVVITELPHPLAVRRTVSFSEAVYEGRIIVEGVTGRLANPDQLHRLLTRKEIPVIIDPAASILKDLPDEFMVIDARMLKRVPQPLQVDPAFFVGLGPGFTAGQNCDVVVETRRGHTLGRTYWSGSVTPDSGQPDGDARRVLRAPAAGIFSPAKQIGDHCEAGEAIAEIQDAIDKDSKTVVSSHIKGVLRGLIRPGFYVTSGLKIGDVDPRDDASLCDLVSEKSLAVAGGVLEAILSKTDIRNKLWG